MRHKDDSAQENKGHGYNLDHRTTRFCAPGPGNEHFGTNFRTVPSSLTLLQWTLSKWTRRWGAKSGKLSEGPCWRPGTRRLRGVADSPDSFSPRPAPDANHGLWTRPGAPGYVGQ